MASDTPSNWEAIPFAVPDVTELEIQAVTEVLRSRWITTGPKVAEFERKFAEAVGARHAVALNSCTAALHLSLEAIGLNRGDLVYMSPFTFAATAEVVRYFGATPVFVDIEATTLNLDPELLEARVRADAAAGKGCPKVVIPVHMAGVPCDMERIWEIAASHTLSVIEDAAHAFPASRDGVVTGSIPVGITGTVCYSFYATKTITTGEGGMLVTNSDVIADRVRTMSLHGLSRQAWGRYAAGGSWRYDIVAPGFKYNLTDIAAAMGLVQLDRSQEMRDRRAEIAQLYDAAFADLDCLETPTVPPRTESAWHLYPIRFDLAGVASRDGLIAYLSERNIGTSVHFIPLHMHSYYRGTYGYMDEDFPVAFEQFNRVMSLPIYSGMTDEQVSRVISGVRCYVGSTSN